MTTETSANAANGLGVAGAAWLPIESAPKDGTIIDLWVGGEYPSRWADAYWGRPQHSCGEAGRYCDCCPSYDGWVDSSFNQYLTGEDGFEDEPTHWMPLPPAPTPQEARHEGEAI